jgi:hypothetical protein
MVMAPDLKHRMQTVHMRTAEREKMQKRDTRYLGNVTMLIGAAIITAMAAFPMAAARPPVTGLAVCVISAGMFLTFVAGYEIEDEEHVEVRQDIPLGRR